MIFWKFWNWPLYSRQCLLYWLHWHLVIKRVHWLSNSQPPHHHTTNYGCQDIVELDSRVAWASLPISRIHPQVAPTSKMQWLLSSLHNTGWQDVAQVCHGSFEAILILDPVNVEEEYSHIASRYHCLQWHVSSCGWRYASLARKKTK